jgi:hypothetical protein
MSAEDCKLGKHLAADTGTFQDIMGFVAKKLLDVPGL